MIYMNMLNLDLSTLNAVGNQHMIQLLRILVEDVGVTLIFGNVCCLVNFGEEFVERGKDHSALSVFVHIARDNDVG